MIPKFIERIHVDIPKDLITKFDENMDMVCGVVNKVCVQQVEAVGSEIINQIRDIAVANGIDDVYVLKKKDILSALEKQIPKEPTHEATLYKCLTCPNCKNVIDEFMEFVPEQPKIRVKNPHCKYCGQALDWSDTE